MGILISIARTEALGAAIHLDLNLVRIDRDVTADHRKYLLAQHRDQVGLAD